MVDDITESFSSESDSPYHQSVTESGALLDERHSMRAASPGGDNLRKKTSQSRGRASRTQVVIVVGPPGYAMFNYFCHDTYCG